MRQPISIKEALSESRPLHISEIGNDTEIPESELQLRLIKYLERRFIVGAEVWNNKHTKRIDLVIIHNSDSLKEFPIGIEIKTTSKKRGKELAGWIKQASEYSQHEFPPFGKCLIVTCPQVSGYYLREGEFMHQHETEEGYGFDNNISTFLGQFNIGEFQKYFHKGNTFYRIVFKGSIIWDSRDNILRTHNYVRLWKR